MIDPTEKWEHLGNGDIIKRLLSWERIGHQVRAEDIAFAQQALADAEVAPQGSQEGTKP